MDLKQFALTMQVASKRQWMQKANLFDFVKIRKFSATWGNLYKCYQPRCKNDLSSKYVSFLYLRWSSCMSGWIHLQGQSEIVVHFVQDLTCFLDGWVVDWWCKMLNMLAHHANGEKTEFVYLTAVDGQGSETSWRWFHNHHWDYGSFDAFTSPEGELEW